VGEILRNCGSNAMPGLLPHLIAGCAMFIIGRYYFKSYFDGDDKIKERLILAVVCLLFSIIPDFFLGIHYTTHIWSRCTLMPYQKLTHLVLFPVAIAGLFILTYLIKTKRKPVWIMGLWSIIVHLTVDLFIPSTSVLI